MFKPSINFLRTGLVLGMSVLGSVLTMGTAHAFDISYSVNGSSYSVNGSETANDLLNAFNASSPSYCNGQALNGFTNVSSNNLCGSGNSNLAYLLEVGFSLDGTHTVDFQAGMDWGNGGGVIEDGNLEYITSDDIWWSYNWGNADVIQTSHILGAGSHSLKWIGFENCCNGLSSMRFRVDGSEWQDLNASNFAAYEGTPTGVPVPAPFLIMAPFIVYLLRRKA